TSALFRLGYGASDSLIVATFVVVPSPFRAASSHSSFTSTVMRVMAAKVHQLDARRPHQDRQYGAPRSSDRLARASVGARRLAGNMSSELGELVALPGAAAEAGTVEKSRPRTR